MRGLLRRLWQSYSNFRPFSEQEAWSIFRLAAITEAVGWTLLISGILISKYATPGNDLAVQLAGRFHGTFFLFYIVAVLVFSPSQRWSWRRILVGGLASVPPYGSLIFEQWAAFNRQHHKLHQTATLAAYRWLVTLQPSY